MAGDWIPIEVETPRKQEVLRIANITGMSRHEVLGALVDFWCWVSAQSVDGHVDADVDTLCTHLGAPRAFWEALITVGWLESDGENDDRLRIPNAEHWITKASKSRLAKNRRQKQWRLSGGANESPKRLQKRLPQKRREEKSIKKERSTSLSLAQRIYEAYPRHIGKAKAIPAIEKAIELIAERDDLMSRAAADWLLGRVQAFAASPLGQPDTKPDTPYPATWFSGKHGGRYDDDDSEWLKIFDQPTGRNTGQSPQQRGQDGGRQRRAEKSGRELVGDPGPAPSI